MHNKKGISVVIPAYNCQLYIKRAIESVLSQTRPADEVIVVDDGSTDGTAEVVGAYGSKVILLQQENAGVSAARNAGIRAASGDWIAFLDADDEWLPDKLDAQDNLFAHHPQLKWGYANFLSQAGNTFNPEHPEWKEQPPDKLFFDDYFEGYCRGFFAWTGTVIIHRSVFDIVGLFEAGMKRGQDNDLWYRIAYQYPQVGYLRQPLAVYHLDNPVRSTKINDKIDFMINLIDRHTELSKKYNRYEPFYLCIRHMLQVWIRQLTAQRRYADVQILLDRFSDYLPARFIREMSFRLLLPALTNPIADAWMKIKRSCLLTEKP